MDLRRYKPKFHASYLRELLVDRGLDLSLEEDLPLIGYIVFTEKNGMVLAIGFIRRLEPRHIGMLDMYITHSKAMSYQRNEALDILTSALIGRAKKMKLIRLMATSSVQSIIERSLKYGFEIIPNMMTIVLKLEMKEKPNEKEERNIFRDFNTYSREPYVY